MPIKIQSDLPAKAELEEENIFDVNRVSKIQHLFPGHCAADQETQRLRYIVLNIKGKYLKCACTEAFQCSHRANSVPG